MFVLLARVMILTGLTSHPVPRLESTNNDMMVALHCSKRCYAFW